MNLSFTEISSLTNLVLMIVLIITSLRRKPALEGQFADQAKNEVDHDRLHRRIGCCSATRPPACCAVFAAQDNNKWSV